MSNNKLIHIRTVTNMYKYVITVCLKNLPLGDSRYPVTSF